MFRALHLSSKLGYNVVKNVLGMETEDPIDMMQQMGGVYGKVAQATSLNEPDRSVFDECVPLNKCALEARVLAYCEDNHLHIAVPLTLAGSGSIGGVFSARHADGRRVAVKVRYPGIEEMMEQDLSLMEMMGTLSGHSRILPQLRASLLRELDYRSESANLAAIGQLWAGSSIEVPAVVGGLSPEEDVVVMEYLEGTPAAPYLKSATESQKAALCMEMVEFCLGTWSQGYIYADPHWGNFKVSASGHLQVLDFGNVERCTQEECRLHRRHLASAGTVKRDEFGSAYALDFPGLDTADLDYHYELYRLFNEFILSDTPKDFDAAALARFDALKHVRNTVKGGGMILKMILLLVNILCHTDVQLTIGPLYHRTALLGGLHTVAPPTV